MKNMLKGNLEFVAYVLHQLMRPQFTLWLNRSCM